MAIEVSLRQATQADFDFARDVHHRSMRSYVEPLFGWDKADQASRFRANFSLDGAWVISSRGQDIGWLKILDHKDRTDLRQVFILPEYQNQGIGTTVLTRLRSKWQERGSSVTLGVFKNNPARRLYQRLGFRVVSEEEHKYIMRWDREA